MGKINFEVKKQEESQMILPAGAPIPLPMCMYMSRWSNIVHDKFRVNWWSATKLLTSAFYVLI